jgi:hypothetical protein
MKKFVFVAVALISSVAICSAQSQTCQSAPVLGDTVVNTATVNKSVGTGGRVTGAYSAASVQIIITKISGTVAGTTKLQGSLNGTNWEDIGSAFTHTDVASQAKLFTITGGVPYTYLRTTSTGSGTMSASVSLCYVLKKFQ